MFKKLINDSRSEEWNITMYAIILVVLFIIVFTPIILIGINMYPELAFQYAKNKDNVMEYVDKHMKNVKDLDGIWSVDILETENNELWLIDMAEGHRSAYWDINKVKGVN